jgi:branched-subunit amino acid ABC-type transport system permease component
MSLDIAVLLAQDGLVNGAIYALLAVTLVLVFSVTRVIFIPQGEFVAWGGLTLAALQAGRVPGTYWLLCAAALGVAALEAWDAARRGDARTLPGRLLRALAAPVLLGAVLWRAPFGAWPGWVQVPLALALVVPLGPAIHRIAFQPAADAPVLVLLIISVAVHLALTALGLLAFGPEGSRTRAFSEAQLPLAGATVPAQALLVVLFSGAVIAALWGFFGHTLTGKALRASAGNRTGARLVGIPTAATGRLSFALAALIGAFSGILIAPITTLYYDTGFLIGLKGFVGAIFGGLASYPLAAAGAILVGLAESAASFEASAYKEVIVFTLVLPVMLWRSLRTRHVEEDG